MSENNINLDGILCENDILKHINDKCNSNLERKKFMSKLLVGSSSNNSPSSNENEVIVMHKQEGKENIEIGGNKKRSLPASEVQTKGKDEVTKKGKGVCQGRYESLLEHEIHIRKERERRKNMRNMFVDLHALLPQLPPKADKCTIIDEAVNYIKTLETTLQDLQKRKQEKQQQGANNKSREALMADYQDPIDNNPMAPRYPMAFQTWANSNVVLNICGNEAQFSVCSPKKAGILTVVCFVFEKHVIEVLSAHVTSSHIGYMCMFQTRLGSADDDGFIEPFLLQENYKMAASEIAYWLSL